MGGMIWVAIIAAVGSSGVAGALVAWAKDRRKDSIEVTQMIRQISKEAVADAHSELSDLRSDMRDIKAILRELATTVERDVIPLLGDHPETQASLHKLTVHAKEIA